MDALATVIAALIGAALGSIGAVVVEQRYGRQAELGRTREVLVRRYLFLLQDAVESLWYRLENIELRGGASVMDTVDPGYRTISSLYALARVLAVERILALEGVYPQLKQTWPEVGSFLRDHRVDLRVEGLFEDELFHYHLQGLAEGALVQEADTFRVMTYSEFRRRYEDDESGLERSARPVAKVLDKLDKDRSKKLRNNLRLIALTLDAKTGVPSPIGKKPNKGLVETEPARPALASSER